jgi:hypothetical protein
VRTAVFTTTEPAGDTVRLMANYDVELALLDAPADIDATALPPEVAAVLERAPADVAVLSGSAAPLVSGAEVCVPFGGGEHDWAALELGAWLCSCAEARLTLIGTRADASHGTRDASRLLADASLAVQRVAGVDTEALLAEPTDEGLSGAVESAALVVVGISPRWRADGIGAARRALVRHGRAPVVLVHRGPRPGGLAPRDSATRFTWSIDLSGSSSR